MSGINTTNAVSLLCVIGASQGILLSLALFKIGKGAQSIFLPVLILIVSLEVLDETLYYSRLILDVPHLLAVFDPLILLFGPAFYFYMESITGKYKFRYLHLLHLIPLGIYLFRIFPLYFESAEFKLSIIELSYENYTSLRGYILNAVINVILATYLFFGARIFFGFYKEKKVPFLPKSFAHFKTVRTIIIGILAVFVLNMVRFFFFYDAESVIWIPLVISVLFYFLGYMNLSRRELLSEIVREVPGPAIQREEDKLVVSKLNRLFEEKIHLKSTLSLEELARECGTSRNKLSEIINQHYALTFFNLLNKMRVEEAKRIIAGNPMFKLEAIYADIGFNSKSAFNAAFKKFAGETPSEFRDRTAKRGI